MNAPSPTASVIVLNYNGGRFLDPLLASLEAQTFRDFELIMVDNASTDGSRERLQTELAGRFRLIANARNLGFAGGNNVAIREARGRYLVFLNNDTTVEPDWLAELVAAAEARPEAGSFACQIRSQARPELMDTSGIIIYPDGMSRGQGRLEPASAYETPGEVFAPSCCACLYRREVIETVGGFDADFFAYCEDMDLGMRARMAGWTSWYVPTARVYHHYSGTSGEYSTFKAFLVERNHRWLMLTLFPWRMVALAPLWTLWRYALQAYGVFAGRGASGEFAKGAPATQLLGVLVRAYWETLTALPALWRKRRAYGRFRRASAAEMASWFRRWGISAAELTLKA